MCDCEELGKVLCVSVKNLAKFVCVCVCVRGACACVCARERERERERRRTGQSFAQNT